MENIMEMIEKAAAVILFCIALTVLGRYFEELGTAADGMNKRLAGYEILLREEENREIISEEVVFIDTEGQKTEGIVWKYSDVL